MPGYHLVERSTWVPHDPAERPFERLGFLDFLRQLAEAEAAIPLYSDIAGTGLEEVLFVAQGQAAAHEIRPRIACKPAPPAPLSPPALLN
jgi:hypothetical protein